MRAVLSPSLRYEIIELIDERIQEKHVTKEDFTELKGIVKELAEVQKRTELKVGELAEVQKRTELRVGELAEVQKRTELRVEELAEAQKRTELRVEELAEAQKEAQKEIKVLALAMEDTKNELKDTRRELKDEVKDTRRDLDDKLKNTRRDLGGLTSTLGFMLENEAYRVLPDILKDKYGIEVKEKFLRRSIRSLGINEEGEINIFSRGVHKDKGIEITIIGESRSQLGKDDIDDLLELSTKLKGIDKKEEFLLAITHYAKETVIEYARKKGVEVIQSFEW
ncbi:MAG: hypothetical protein QME42_09660 [bacterium]|nr:hypothetical protein [bacterium]